MSMFVQVHIRVHMQLMICFHTHCGIFNVFWNWLAFLVQVLESEVVMRCTKSLKSCPNLDYHLYYVLLNITVV